VVELPDDADPSRAEATYKNGVLKVVIPKDESSKPRQITVGGAA
jgi:HSP20 family protein